MRLFAMSAVCYPRRLKQNRILLLRKSIPLNMRRKILPGMVRSLAMQCRNIVTA